MNGFFFTGFDVFGSVEGHFEAVLDQTPAEGIDRLYTELVGDNPVGSGGDFCKEVGIAAGGHGSRCGGDNLCVGHHGERSGAVEGLLGAVFGY